MKLPTLFAAFAFAYLLFFTQGLPPFWEALQTFESFTTQSFLSLVQQTLSFSGNVLEKNTPAHGLYFKTVFFLFGQDVGKWRVAKALAFASMIFVLVLLLQELFVSRTAVVSGALLITTSFPLYIHSMVIDEPFILAEFWKYAALLVFFKDLRSPTFSFWRICLLYSSLLLAFKTYPPAIAILPPLVFFTALYYRHFMKRYFFAFLLIGIMVFPFSNFLSGTIAGPFGIHLENVPLVFLQGLRQNLFSPLAAIDFSNYTFRGLYWKPFPFVVTFFGLWTILISFVFLTYSLLRKRFASASEKLVRFPCFQLVLFAFVWMLSEFPIFVSVPEPALRYTSAFITPLVIALTSIILFLRTRVRQRTQRSARRLLCTVVIVIILINMTHTFFFRALLGSETIAMEHVSHVLKNTSNACVVYAPLFVADHFLYLNTTNTYAIRTDLRRIPTIQPYHYSGDYFRSLKSSCSRIFIVQYKSFLDASRFPPLAYEEHKEMKLIQHIIGKEDTLYDSLIALLQRKSLLAPLHREYFLWEFRI